MKNGFTLIELLAVLVILAIIALIAVPIVLNIIRDSKEESNKRSIEMYASALKNAVAHYQLLNNKNVTGKYITNDGKTLNGNVTLIVKYDGNVVCDTIEIYEDGNIYLANCKVNDEFVEYSYGELKKYKNGEIVYFDVIKGIGCTEKEYNLSYDETLNDYLNSQTGYNGIIEENDISNKNSCLKFYAFLDDGSDKINLLLDHNTIGNIRWSTDNYNTYGPTKSILLNNTNKWQGMEEPKLYNLDQTKQGSGVKYTVNYKDYKARLIEANEIAKKQDQIN